MDVVHVRLAGEPEVGDFVVLAAGQDVLRLHVAVDVPQVYQLFEAPNDMREHIDGLLLFEFAAIGVELFAQVALT